MKRKLLGVLAGTLLLVSSSSRAAEASFGSQGQLTFGADRLFGFYGYKAGYTYTQVGIGEYEDSQSGTMFNLLWGPSSTGGDLSNRLSVNPWIVPRLSFDYFVADGWSVGGSIGYAFTSGEYSGKSAPPGRPVNVHTELPDSNAFIFAPRGGYAYMFGRVVGIWPRLGFSYARLHSDWIGGGTKHEHTASAFDLNLEAMFVIAPVDHFAFTVGPLIDIPLAGGWEYRQTQPAAATVTDGDIRLWNYGVAAGILGYF